MLEIKDFSKSYKGGKKAVDHLNLKVEAGDIFGFIGHNGAGKSTTIKSLVGILDFEEGDIFIDGKSIRKEPLACKKELAYLPDNPDLYENMKGIEYLEFIGDVFEVPGKEREEFIKKYGDYMDITSSLGMPISAYSHGMKQKVAVIGALMHKPKLMVMDEPFVGLDPKAMVVFKQAMRELCAEGSAVFFSTHVLDVAQNLCNKIAIIKNGQLMVTGETEKLTQDESLESLFMEVIDHEK
ncbi:ABC transporter ATP-binding protein [Lachnospiraceae bacterium OttesenSCG-928-E19]|nr:ABC transporter ATP-binding protein [Lachnospiraceae bacterium OttesenSCG-928-E19]